MRSYPRARSDPCGTAIDPIWSTKLPNLPNFPRAKPRMLRSAPQTPIQIFSQGSVGSIGSVPPTNLVPVTRNVPVQQLPPITVILQSSQTPGVYQATRTPGGTHYVPIDPTAAQTSASEHSEPRRHRPLWKKILMAPIDGLTWVIKKWCNPSEECLRCVQITYWFVIIVG